MWLYLIARVVLSFPVDGSRAYPTAHPHDAVDHLCFEINSHATLFLASPSPRKYKQGYYWIQFGCLAICCAMLEMQKMGTKERVTMPQNFITFRNGYLFVYSLMMGECVLF